MFLMWKYDTNRDGKIDINEWKSMTYSLGGHQPPSTSHSGMQNAPPSGAYQYPSSGSIKINRNYPDDDSKSNDPSKQNPLFHKIGSKFAQGQSINPSMNNPQQPPPYPQNPIINQNLSLIHI